MAHISLYTCESFVWIDETGSNKKDHIRKRELHQSITVFPVVVKDTMLLLQYHVLTYWHWR